MSKSIDDIRSVVLIDDDPNVRQGLKYQVDFADLRPVEEAGPNLGSLDHYLKTLPNADAAISDFHLRPSGYAAFNGAELVARLQRSNFPALLCTRFDRSEIDRIRPHRRWIPVLMAADELNPESLMEGLEVCLFELAGNFRPIRRPWRSQVYFLENDTVDNSSFFVELPGWQRNETIRVSLSHLPVGLQTLVRPGFRCYAQANLGTENADELYLSDWEVP